MSSINRQRGDSSNRSLTPFDRFNHHAGGHFPVIRGTITAGLRASQRGRQPSARDGAVAPSLPRAYSALFVKMACRRVRTFAAYATHSIPKPMTTPSRRVIALAPMPPEKSARPWRATVGLRTPLKKPQVGPRAIHLKNSGNSFISTTVMVRLRISATSLSVLNRFRSWPRFGWKTNKSGTASCRVGIKTSPPPAGMCRPPFEGREIEAVYLGILRGLSTVYRALHDPLSQFLTEQEPRPDSMTPAAYQRAIAARAFDVTRYLLPLAAQNQCRPGGQHSDARKQITRLLVVADSRTSSDREDLQDACRSRP